MTLEMSERPAAFVREPERIEAAAVRVNGKVWWLMRPCRHCHVIQMLTQALECDDWRRAEPRAEQGFITNRERFVGRIEGADIALRAGQISALQWPPYLYSEDLW